ncbi:PTS sugar transporter [Salmonella enterica]|nr:PTS sugar transporter [Salmonella enterica]
MKKIAIIGSSGGNLYNLGGAEPEKLLQEIYQQCEAAGVNVAAVQFIAAEASMDVAKPDTPASVYALTTENQQKPTKTTAHISGQTFGGKHLGSRKRSPNR